jgi:hypothetical protein
MEGLEYPTMKKARKINRIDARIAMVRLEELRRGRVCNPKYSFIFKEINLITAPLAAPIAAFIAVLTATGKKRLVQQTHRQPLAQVK